MKVIRTTNRNSNNKLRPSTRGTEQLLKIKWQQREKGAEQLDNKLGKVLIVSYSAALGLDISL